VSNTLKVSDTLKVNKNALKVKQKMCQ